MCKKEGVVVHCPANTEERLLNYVRAEVILFPPPQLQREDYQRYCILVADGLEL